MTRRYVTLHRPRLADWYDGPDAEDYLSRTVYETESTPQQTGLYDCDGNELYSLIEKDPIGFVRWDDTNPPTKG